MLGLVHIKADGSVGDLGRRVITLEQCQELVASGTKQGWVEPVAIDGKEKYGAGQQCMMVHEEGLLHGLPPNPVASGRARRPIVGDVVIIEWEQSDYD